MIFPPIAAKLGLGVSFALAAALIATGLWGVHQKSKRLAVQAEFAQYKADANAAASIASENNRRKEQEDAERVRQIEASARERQAQHEKALASVRASADADRRLLVNRIAELGSNPSPEGAASAPSDGADAIGELLADGLRVQAALAAAAESAADAYRALREARPVD